MMGAMSGAVEAPPSTRGRATTWAGRALPILAPIVYLGALAITTFDDGLPLARDQMFFWLLLGLGAFSIAAWRSWGILLLEWLPLLALLVAYDYLRGAVPTAPGQAHIMPQLDFDRWLTLGNGQVPTNWLQDQLYDVSHLHWYDYLTWVTYMSHFFMIWIVAAVLWKAAHDRFRRYVAFVVLVTLFAFAGYWLYPAQPPWLAAQESLMSPITRIVPYVWGQLGVRTAQSVWEGHGDLVNLVAAMPSLHASYPFMLLLFFWPTGWKVRIPLMLYSLAMGFALVYSGEHFVIDILAGWVLTAIAFLIVVFTPRAWRALALARQERRRQLA
jgi:membrane-associated phospholipid phosphatase